MYRSPFVSQQTYGDALSRREFVARAAAAGLTIGALATASRAAGAAAPPRREAEPVIAVFSKHLQWLAFADVGPVVAESGFRAVDLTVRPGGHVLPERVEEDLPRAVETLRKSGLTVPLITTAITDALCAAAPRQSTWAHTQKAKTKPVLIIAWLNCLMA